MRTGTPPRAAFTAAQAAQKVHVVVRSWRDAFTAAQAAQKWVR